MKTLKYLTIFFAVCCFITPIVFAVEPCSTSLDDSLDPSGNIYQDADTIEYVANLAIANPTNCNITDIEVFFFAPDNPPNAGNPCDATNGVKIFDGGALELAFGDPAIILDSTVDTIMAYSVDEADADASGFLYAYICTKFNAITPLGKLPGSDNKPSINKVISPDFMVDKTCVNPEGTLIGQDAEFKITITNTGDVDLDFVINDASAVPALVDVGVGPIAPDANYVTTITIPTTGECELDQLVSNLVEVEGYYDGQLIDTKSDSADCPVLCPPSFIANKYCLTEPVTDEPNALFEIVIENDGFIPLTFEIDDPAAGLVDYPFGPIAPGDSNSLIVEVPADCNDGVVSNSAVVTAIGTDLLPMPIDAECPCAGLEGCTPGFWKNHPDCWDCYDEGQTLEDIFGDDWDSQFDELADDTLMDALNYKGGKSYLGRARNMLRHAAAALLNTCDPDVDYPLTEQQIIDYVNDALDSIDLKKWPIIEAQRLFRDFNELGCPIDAHCDPKPVDDVIVY